MRYGEDTRGHRCRRAAGGTARRVFEVPWIVAGTVEPRLGIRVQAELGARAAPHEHEAGLFAARHVGGLVISRSALRTPTGKARRCPPSWSLMPAGAAV